MKGDFSRNTFDPLKHFSRVLMQQGRVQLDADWNEQVAILLHYLQTLAADLIGPYGGVDNGFKIEATTPASKDFFIHDGHYYVDGILCDCQKRIKYFVQDDYPISENEKLGGNKNYLVYLDVWERHITCLEDEDGSNPSIREVALGGPDTATRAKVVWQVKTTNTMPNKKDSIALPQGQVWRAFVDKNWPDWLKNWQPSNRGQLRAKGREDSENDTNPCITSPESRYRGAENQLYRVEIHRGGKAGEATFKCSRENGSVVFPILALNGMEAKLEHLGRDSRFGLKIGDWVEVRDDEYVLRNCAEPLWQVDTIDPVNVVVTLLNAKDTNTAKPRAYSEGQAKTKHALLRRWDHKAGEPKYGGLELDNDGAAKVVEAINGNWLTLEDGVQIQFVKAGANEKAHYYRTGDYWLIPARTATGDVEWPQDDKGAMAQPPHGVEHHYAPLWIISVGPEGSVNAPEDNDCQRKIKPLWDEVK